MARVRPMPPRSPTGSPGSWSTWRRSTRPRRKPVHEPGRRIRGGARQDGTGAYVNFVADEGESASAPPIRRHWDRLRRSSVATTRQPVPPQPEHLARRGEHRTLRRCGGRRSDGLTLTVVQRADLLVRGRLLARVERPRARLPPTSHRASHPAPRRSRGTSYPCRPGVRRAGRARNRMLRSGCASGSCFRASSRRRTPSRTCRGFPSAGGRVGVRFRCEVCATSDVNVEHSRRLRRTAVDGGLPRRPGSSSLPEWLPTRPTTAARDCRRAS